ncbi:hypothetical protein F4677DRAFT_236397 [Hypoxylon crocopeplum]|nr:hypothetical protein F4677DRAFT_236397 [Hypoxylon crocopeplum]
MPRYRSPSPSPDPHRSPSSPSYGRSLSVNSRPRRQHSPSPTHSDSRKDVLKTSLVFLGAIGAASLAASKLWPKGILYGEKESWAQKAKEEVKHVVRGDGSDDREHRRRPRSIGNSDGGTRQRRPPRVDIRDEIVVAKPSGRVVYVDSGWNRHIENGQGYRGRQHVVDPRDRRPDFDDDPYGPRGSRGSSYVDR